jgi:hypothetical protein
MAFTAKQIKPGLRYRRDNYGYTGVLTEVPAAKDRTGVVYRRVESVEAGSYAGENYTVGQVGPFGTLYKFMELLDEGVIKIIHSPNGFVKALRKWKELQ